MKIEGWAMICDAVKVINEVNIWLILLIGFEIILITPRLSVLLFSSDGIDSIHTYSQEGHLTIIEHWL